MDRTRACSKSTRVTHFDYTLLAWTKNKRSLRNEKLKANRASETEEQRKERLRIRRENEKNRKPRETAPNHSHDNDLKRNQTLEKVVSSKQLRLAV